MKKPDLSQVDYRAFYDLKSLQEKLKFLLQFAELAPSRMNTRPWKFEINDYQIRIYSDFSRRLDRVDPFNRELYISMGCVLANIEIAAEFFGLYYSSCIFTGEPLHNLFGVLTFDPNRKPKHIYPETLFPAIGHRHVSRDHFQPQSIETKEIDSLYDSIEWIEDISLYMTNNTQIKEYLGFLTFESEKEQFNNPSTRDEFYHWIATQKPGGLSVSELRLPIADQLFYVLYPRYNIGPHKAAHDKELISEAPYIALLLTRHDTIIDWISAGIAFQVMSLKAVSMNLSFQPVTSCIEIPYYRDKVQDLIESTKVPQMLIRLGHESSTPPSTTT